MNFKATFPPPKTKITTITGANYAVLDTDFLVLVDVSGASRTITLPVAAGRSGQVFKIKRIDQTLNFSVDIIVASSGTIDGQTTRRLSTQYDEIEVVSDGSTWQVLNRYIKSEHVSYTPTYTGFGTVTVTQATWRRVGDSIYVQGRFTPGTTTATEARVSLPSGLSIDSGKVTNNRPVGQAQYAGGSGQSYRLAGVGGNSYVTFLTVNLGATGGLTNFNGNAIASASIDMAFQFIVPITNWEG